MVDSTFYDKNWTVLNKIRYLEKWFKENSLEPNSIKFTTVQDGTNVSISVSGTTYDGNEVSLPNAFTFTSVRGEQGYPLCAINDNYGTNKYIVGNIITLHSSDITPNNYGVGSIVIGMTRHSDTPQIALCEIKSIINDEVSLEVISVNDLPIGGGGTPSEDTSNIIADFSQVFDSREGIFTRGPLNLIEGKRYEIHIFKSGVIDEKTEATAIPINLDGIEVTVLVPSQDNSGSSFIEMVSVYNGMSLGESGPIPDENASVFIIAFSNNAPVQYPATLNIQVKDIGFKYFMHSGLVNIEAVRSSDDENKLSGFVQFRFISLSDLQHGTDEILDECVKQGNYGSVHSSSGVDTFTLFSNRMLLPSNPLIDNAIGYSILSWTGGQINETLLVDTIAVGTSTSDNSLQHKRFSTLVGGCNIYKSDYNIVPFEEMYPIDVAL